MKRPVAVLLLVLAACGVPGQPRAVGLQLTNAGLEPLRCKIVFGHWVERDLGEVAPAASLDIALLQAASDHALYINRSDNQRQMMIENIVCGRVANWRETLGQVDLTRARQRDISHLEATCEAPRDAGRVTCRVTGIGI